jgi:hypothetical protein
MSFGLKNIGATYQRCMHFCFKGQIGCNLEVYVDDIIMNSQKSGSLIFDLEETFSNLRRFNIKLNTEKCTFRVPRASSWGTSSPSAASKETLIRSQSSLKWARSETSRMFNDSWGVLRPSAASCPDWGSADSPCTSY